MFTIAQDEADDYDRAATFIVDQARSTWQPRTSAFALHALSALLRALPLHQLYDAVFLQHEYGIFGGYRGELVLRLLRGAAAAVPVVMTLHTVETVPSPMVQHIMHTLLKHSTALVALSPSGCRAIDSWNDTVGASGLHVVGLWFGQLTHTNNRAAYAPGAV